MAKNKLWTTSKNTMGLGNPMLPYGIKFTKGKGIGNTGKDFHDPKYRVGSGDR